MKRENEDKKWDLKWRMVECKIGKQRVEKENRKTGKRK